MHKRLLALMVVLLISITMSVPALAQEEEEQQAAMDVSSVFTAEFCPIIQQDSGVYDLMLQMFPGLAETCPE